MLLLRSPFNFGLGVEPQPITNIAATRHSLKGVLPDVRNCGVCIAQSYHWTRQINTWSPKRFALAVPALRLGRPRVYEWLTPSPER